MAETNNGPSLTWKGWLFVLGLAIVLCLGAIVLQAYGWHPSPGCGGAEYTPWGC